MTRRGNGEGSVPRPYVRDGKDTGRFYGQIWVAGKRHTVYGKNAAEVRRGYRQLIERHESGAPVKDAKTKVKTWAETWSATALVASGRAQSTVDNYRGLVRRHVVPQIGELAIGAVRKSHLDGILLAMVDRGLAAGTRIIVHSLMRDLFAEAVAEELIKVSPMLNVKRPGAEDTEAVFLDRQEAVALMRALDDADTMLQDLVRLMMLTGLRRGEALGLSWDDVDEDEGVIRVRQSLQRTSKGLGLGPLKTRGSRREVPIVGKLAEVLQRRRQTQRRERLAAPLGTYLSSGLVFTQPLGQPWEPRRAAKRFAEVRDAAGLPAAIHLHTMRHSYATMALAEGVSIKAIQKVLGHSSHQVTADIYTHVLPELQREAMRKVAEAAPW